MLAVTVAGYGQDAGQTLEPCKITLDNSVNEGDPFRNFCHEKEIVVYLKPGDKKAIEVFSAADDIISKYVRWYMGDPEKEITEYIKITNPGNSLDNKSSNYVYYNTNNGQNGYISSGADKGKNNVRYVHLQMPNNAGDDVIIYCDLSRFAASVVETNTVKIPKLTRRYKFILKKAVNMAETSDKYEIHAPVDAEYLTLRLPHELSNYYTSDQDNDLKAPEYLFWKFYRKGNEQQEPVYTVCVKQFDRNGDKEGMLKISGGTLRPHVLDITLERLKLTDDDRKSGADFTVMAFVSTEIKQNDAETNQSQILEIDLQLEPKSQALLETELIGDYAFRSEAILGNTTYYKSLGGLSFNEDDEEHGEGAGGKKIVDAENNTLITNRNLTCDNNTGVIPLQEEYSDYGFSDFKIEGSNDYVGSPARGEYAFLRSIGVPNVSATNQNGYKWWMAGATNKNAYKLYDRRYELTKNEDSPQHGFFMYVDADEVPGLITKLPIGNITLCSQTQIVVTAWVCNLNRQWGNFMDSNIQEKNEGTYSNMKIPTVAGTDISFTFKRENEILYRFYTGEISNNVRRGEGASGDNNNPTPAEWKQIYFTFTIPNITDVSEYTLEVASNCLHSDGGDFAIDDIRAYMTVPNIEAFQEDMCDYTSNIKIRARYDQLLANVGLKELALAEENKILTNTEESSELDGNPDHGSNPRHYHMYYTIAQKKENGAWTYIPLNYAKEPTPSVREIADADLYGASIISANYADMPTKFTERGYAWTEVEDGVRYVVLDIIPLKSEDLKIDELYKVQIFPHEGDVRVDSPDDPCALATDFKIMKSVEAFYGDMAITENTELEAGKDITCEFWYRTNDNNKWEKVVNPTFDWYYGPEGNYSSGEIRDMLRILRSNNPGLNTDSEIDDNSINWMNIDDSRQTFLKTNKQYLLFNSGSFTIPNPIPSQITIVPVIMDEIKNAQSIKYCSDGITLNISPTLTPGDPGATYPPAMDCSIRIGSWQLRHLQKKGEDNNTYLRIPIHRISNASKGLIAVENGTDVRLVEKDGVPVSETTVATLKELKATGKKKDDPKTLDVSENYFDLKFFTHEYSFEEGHTYLLSFKFKKALNNNSKEKDEEVYSAQFTLKVVPEYLTWNGKEGNNWNNDNNWDRSNRTIDLYFSEGESDSDDLDAAFVPMKGSYVTIKGETNTYTQLFSLGEKNGSGLLGNDVITTTSDGKGYPTENIQYELVAEAPNSTTSTDPWDGDSDGSDNGNRYYAISYYGNWCKEIYFKPEAMLQYQQYLTYDKAWVDFELTPERWYTLSSPLQDVVSGDMYLPADDDHFGRQETKAFEDIKYDYDGDNNRFNPAVYQRTWNGTAINYYLGSSPNSSDLIIEGDWSNLHNDVYKPYTTGTGFSVGVQLRDNATVTGNKTLFRLPKADTQYKIQTNSTVGSYGDFIEDAAPNRDNSGKLSQIGEDGSISVSLRKGKTNKYLIGNPFIAMLDMEAFFKENVSLQRQYRILENGVEQVYLITNGTVLTNIPGDGSTTIAPLQGFFVEENTGSTRDVNKVTFNTSMTTVDVTGANSPTLRSATVEAGNPFPKLYISAEREGLRSSTVVACREEASTGFKEGEDMDSMLDPDREEVPMVYTLAGNKAVIINSTPDLHNIPLGVYSSSTKPVTLRFTGMEAFDAPIYLYDVETKSAIELNDEQAELAIPGNTHGRYFLRSDYVPTDNDVVKAKGAISIYSMMPGQVIVSSVDPLTRILVYNLSGQLVCSRTDLHTPTAYLDGLNPGQIYIVRAETADQVQTEKVEVR